MAKKFGIIIISLICVLLLAACGCEHVWLDASCLAPATCKECGKTEGEKLEHQWLDATCDAPKTCELCGATDGAKLKHQWLDATCAEPQTCELCGKTEGEKLEHWWRSPCDANCRDCGAENPDSKGHRELENLSEMHEFCSACGYEVIVEHECNWVDATCTSPKRCTLCLKVDGEALGHSLKDKEVITSCSNCNKVIEVFFDSKGNALYYTAFDVSESGAYINPITSNANYSWGWYQDGTQVNYINTGTFCADGKIYYDGRKLYDVSEKTRDDLAVAASEYVQFTNYQFFTNEYHTIVLVNGDNLFAAEVGQAYVAVDAYGERYVIIHTGYKGLNPEDTMAIQYDWKS